MPLYRSTGKLTGVIEPENVALAQEYLQEDDMAQYLDPPLKGVVEVLTWTLHSDGHNYQVDAFALRELTEAELAQLAREVSGQNSDGLGEGFEQQDWAWSGEDEDEEWEGAMISFDWETNDSSFTRIK